MDKINKGDGFLICIEASNCDHKTCIHKEPHKPVTTRDPHRPNCEKGAFCYYKNISVNCVEYVRKKEKYRFKGSWGLKENKGKIITKVKNINPWEFRGYFEGQEGINFVFQYKDTKEIKEGR